MKRVLLVMCIMAFAVWAQAGVLGTYDFEGMGTELAAKNVMAGIAISDLQVNQIAVSVRPVGDQKTGMTSNWLEIGGDDTESGTAAAFTNAKYLSFSLTNNTGYGLQLESMQMYVGGWNLYTSCHNSRLFSSVQGYDVITADTIGTFGFSVSSVNKTFPAAIDVVPFYDSPWDVNKGVNVSETDFAVANGANITFYMPWVDQSGSNTRWVEIDDIIINGSVVPEPTSMMLLGLGGLLLNRFRK
ncbi:MAG TPA: PEP-CTERM sorting domain-containing protein [Anaerohalosphaeraceae bacterium]|nr:PEP-CTERM sorting domain-containing protein [Anaerohalosphaeraceae bacterium]